MSDDERLKKFLEEKMPSEEKARQIVENYLKGEITLAEIQGFSPESLFKVAEDAYLQFQQVKLK